MRKALRSSVWITVCFWSLLRGAYSYGCTYYNPSDLASCQLLRPDDYNTSNLHNNFSTLLIRVRGIFYPNLLCLDGLYGLKKLTFADIPILDRNAHIISNFSIYTNLTQSPTALLETLEIHIPLRHIDVTFFKRLGHLRYLDLSDTLGLHASDISQVLQALVYAGAPLEYLDLRRSRSYSEMSFDILNIRENILKYLGTFPLKFLDLRANEFVQFDVGFAEFTPHLIRLFIGEYQAPVTNGGSMEYCLWLDISILPNLRELVFDLGPRNGYPAFGCYGAWEQLIPLLTRFRSTRHKANNCSAFSSCECYSKINNCTLLREFAKTIRYTRVHSNDMAGFLPFPIQPKLRKLSISQTELGRVLLERNQYRGFRALQYNLDLEYLVCYPGIGYYGGGPSTYLMSDLRNLKYLDLQNSIGMLDTAFRIWNTAPDLLVLRLGSNYLYGPSFPKSFLNRNPKLSLLNLTNCSANHLPDITKLTNLQTLLLGHNRLEDLPARVTAFLDSLAAQRTLSIDLSGNPLICSCNNQEFLKWLQNTKVVFLNELQIQCHHPLLGQVSPWDIDRVELSRYCSNFHQILTATISTFGSVCGFVLIISLIVRKRWTIRYWLHAARTAWNQKRNASGDGGHDYRYDAFVAYCSQDEEERKWVHLTLTPKLEDEYGFKLCVHHRDFMPGYDIADNIVEAIQNSNKVLVILSPTFLESDWCHFEVRMAREKLIRDRRDSLVLVIYKPLDVPGVRLPRKLIRILERKTYVEWTMNNAGQDLFWEKLSRALKENIYHEAFDTELANIAPSNNKEEADENDQFLLSTTSV